MVLTVGKKLVGVFHVRAPLTGLLVLEDTDVLRRYHCHMWESQLLPVMRKEGHPVFLDNALALLVPVAAACVFAPDLRCLIRRGLRAGVRVGATALVEDRRRIVPTAEMFTLATRDEEV
jgi:hypothetical protein